MTDAFDGSLRFAGFELNIKSQELGRDGRRIPLQLQPFKLLTYLALHPGEAVSREILRDRLWSRHTFVDFEGGLNFCVRQIRKALAEDARHPRLIETLNRRGYRFLAAVEKVHTEPAPGLKGQRITITLCSQANAIDHGREVARVAKEIARFLLSSYSIGAESSPAQPAPLVARTFSAHGRALQTETSHHAMGIEEHLNALATGALSEGAEVRISNSLAAGECLAVLRVE